MIDFARNSVFKLTPIDSKEGHNEVSMMLTNNEQVLYAFKTIRDKVVITNKRLITINVQGITGKKVDYTSLPFSRVQAFSVETSGTLDLDCELDLWFSEVGKVRLEIVGNFDIQLLNKTLSHYIL